MAIMPETKVQEDKMEVEFTSSRIFINYGHREYAFPINILEMKNGESRNLGCSPFWEEDPEVWVSHYENIAPNITWRQSATIIKLRKYIWIKTPEITFKITPNGRVTTI